MTEAGATKDLTTVVSVLLPVAVPGPYSYGVPAGMTVAPGDWVTVPLGPRRVAAVVWDGAPRGDVDPSKLRAIATRHDPPPLDETMRAFVVWVADYTMTEPGAVLKMVLRSGEYLEPEQPKLGVRVSGIEPPRMTDARRRVLAVAEGGLVWDKRTLAEEAGVGVGVVAGLVKARALDVAPLPAANRHAAFDPGHGPPRLSQAQDDAASVLRQAVDGRVFGVHVLDGVTGSGKTEVYFEAIARALAIGRQVLILLPEIALTAEFLARFEARFGAPPEQWHSGVSGKTRGRVWRGTLSGETRIVVGARSALFLPFADLGLVVVDEEHEAAYKQEDRVWYNARDMAVVRGRFAEAAVALVSATPSVETRVNADRGRYRRIVLPDRYGGRDLPSVEIVDMRADPPERGQWLSPPIAEALATCVEGGRQGLLFLNRRGYAPLTLCRRCGHRFACPDCSSWLTEHRFRHTLMCHHCGYGLRTPQNCPACGEADTLVACGPGVERIAEEVAGRFPDARVAVLSSDLMAGPERLRQQFEAVAKGDIDLVIGTQLIAKGHNFPGLAFVGVVDADMGLGFGDLRATERTFQMLSQVVGRAGRGDEPGRALIQTHMPEHPVLQAMVSGNREGFYAREIEARRAAHLPPFARLAAVIVSARDKARARDVASMLSRAAPRDMRDVQVLGPAEAPLALVRGQFRFRFLVKVERDIRVQSVLATWMARAGKVPSSVRVTIDIDPYSFL